MPVLVPVVRTCLPALPWFLSCSLWPTLDNRRTRIVKPLAGQVVLYLSPAGHKELKRYAIGADRKVHDLLLKAIEECAVKDRIREQMRVR